MSVHIPTFWGYDVVVDSGTMPDLIDVDTFNDITGDKWASRADEVSMTLSAVSQAVRNYCGWHVSPSLDCYLPTSGDGRIIALPALRVNSVSKVTEDGVELGAGQYEWQQRGLIRRCGLRNWSSKWGGVEVEYNAGLDDPLLSQVVAQIASNHLAASPGVREEHVGDAGITYNETADGVSGGVTLLERDYAILSSYRLKGVLL